MKTRLLSFIFCLISLTTLAMGQATRCTICGKWNCQIQHKKCTTCGEWDYKCHYNCNHPVPKCSICGKSKCPQKEKHKVCPTCKKYDFQCEYNLNHPCSQCGSKTCKTKNSHPKCSDCKKLIGVKENPCSHNGKHPKCSICEELVERCEYNGTHSMCRICNKYDYQCQYKCVHPLCEDCGLVIDSCKFEGSHTPTSLYELAVSYEKKEDYIKAIRLFKKAAALDVAAAKLQLAYYYGEGKVVEQNDIEKNKLIEEVVRAAEKGNYDAIHNLGMYYMLVFAELKKAEFWLTKASEEGHKDDQYLLGVLFCIQTKVYEAIPWLKKASEQGHLDAMDALGQLYQQGVGGTAKEAFTLFYKCAEEGNASGQYRLAHCYENGIGTAKNIEFAKIWYKKAADQGDEKSSQRLQDLSK